MAKQQKLPPEEIEYIRLNSHQQTVNEIAAYLKRDTRTIRKYIEKYGFAEYGLSTKENDSRTIIKALEKESFYPIKQAQFTEAEFEYFKNQWIDNIKQFNDSGGLLHTEKMQLVDLITSQILLDRLLIQERQYIENILTMKDRLTKEKKKNIANQDPMLIRELEQQIDLLEINKGGLAKAMKEHSSNIQKTMESLKGTRDQRFENIVESKKDFIALMKLLEDEEYAHQQGKYLILFRLAMERERQRLIKYHTFMDGMDEVPFLTPELVERYKIEQNIQ